jgi:hypothetical protein
VSTGGARRGRRDNGLVAAAYAAAGDVDPRVGEHLLDVLAVRGIAAYLQPTADLHPVTRTTTLPSRPTDRLYVDRTHLDTARAYLAQLGPEAPAVEEHDVDSVFAGIVAGFDAEVETASWPEAENLPAGEPAPAQPDTDQADPPPTALRRWSASTVAPQDEPSLLDGLDTFGAGLPADADEEDEEGYTPPPPPPLPRLAPVTILAVAGIVFGVVLLFDPGLLPIDNTAAMTLGFGGILAGFITLVWRLRSGDDDDDWDPDDGAVV